MKLQVILFQKLSFLHQFMNYCSVVRVAGVLEDDDGMLLGQLLEEAVEIVGAGGQYHAVGRDDLAAGAGQGHVHQAAGVQQVLEARERVQRVVVPLQVELLRLHGRIWGLRTS